MTEQRKYVTPSPENSETPLAAVHRWVTPNRLFFVRNHFEVPQIDPETWRLSVGGCVRQPLELTWDELQSWPQRSVFATVECAGNGRSFIQPRVEGVQWGAGAVGHAEWSGVPLELVLEEAGLTDEVREIVFEGADAGVEHHDPQPIHFARSLPLEKARAENTLLAIRMNGELLEPNHGFPVRLLTPGWYGVASVKWLTRIEASSTPFEGYFQSIKYTIHRRTGRGTVVESVGPMPVKSEILKPTDNEELGIGTTRVFGLAWAGEDSVERVQVSTDGGETWSDAKIIGPQAAFSWNLWEFLWEVATPGEHTLLSRAISAGGAVQPVRHLDGHGGYLINFSRPTRVSINPSRKSREIVGDAEVIRRDFNALAERRSRMRLDVELDLTYGAGI